MSQDAHQLQVTNRELEATVAELRRTVMQLEDRIYREEAESRRLAHLISDKNEEIESLKTLVYNQKRENIELQEELQRQLSSPALASPGVDSAQTRIDRGMQTFVDITPPEEVDRMHQQIEELQMQLEKYEADFNDFGATCIRQTGCLDDDASDRGNSPDPELASSFAGDSPIRKPPRLQLNLAIPPNLGGTAEADVVLTARGAGAALPTETHIRIPQSLVTSRSLVTARDTNTSMAAVPLTARRNASEPALVSQTPRVSTADLMRRSYIDPTSTGTGIIGDINYSESQSPKNRQISMSVIENDAKPRAASIAPSVTTPSVAAAAEEQQPTSPTQPRKVIDNDDSPVQETFSVQQFRRHQSTMSPVGASVSPGENHLNINSSPRASVVTDGDAACGGHMFSIEDADGGCPVCSLMDQIQTMYTGQQVTKEAYYAVGWIPEMCHRWSLEHNIAWTIEERAAVATALTNRTKLSAFTTFTHRGPVSIWRKRPFWRSAWRSAYAVLQGVFLYVFNSNKPNEPVVAVIPVRASFIELVTLNGRQRCLQISSLGCMSCVGATAGDCVETMTIALASQNELSEWEAALQKMQKTCAHKCSQKFMNEMNAIREIAEILITVAKENDKKIADKERRNSEAIKA